MRSLIRCLAFASLVVAALLPPAAPSYAHEAAQSALGNQSQVVSAAPLAAKANTTAAVSPTISPAAYRTYHLSDIINFSCGPYMLCLYVWDYTTSDWKGFDLYYCNRYYLYNWLGDGYYSNNQSEGTTAVFYGQYGNTLWTNTPNPDVGLNDANWDPVWSIRNC